MDAIIKAYRLYLDEVHSQDLEPQISVTRAWCLVKFMDNKMVTMTPCSNCGGRFVTHPYELASRLNH